MLGYTLYRFAPYSLNPHFRWLLRGIAWHHASLLAFRDDLITEYFPLCFGRIDLLTVGWVIHMSLRQLMARCRAA